MNGRPAYGNTRLGKMPNTKMDPGHNGGNKRNRSNLLRLNVRARRRRGKRVRRELLSDWYQG